MDIKNMVRDFASLGEAKKRSSVYVKAVSLLCAAIVVHPVGLRRTGA